VEPRGQQDPDVPREVLRERLLRLRADDRIELVLLLVTLCEARPLERLGLDVVGLLVWPVPDAETVEADASGEGLAAQRAHLHLVEVERGILLELLVDDVLKLERRELKDVVRRDLLWCDLQLLLREEFQIHHRLP